MKKFKRYSTVIIASVIADTLLFGGGCLAAESIAKVKVPAKFTAKFIFAGSMFLATVDSVYRIYKHERKEKQDESRKEQEV